MTARAAPTTGYGAWFGSIPNMDGATGGVLIDGTSAGSPAEKAGLKAGDRILSIAGVRMDELRSMAELLRTKVPGDTVEVLFQRGGTMEKAKVILGVRPGN
jgi:S1-C subfamily serine protease